MVKGTSEEHDRCHYRVTLSQNILESDSCDTLKCRNIIIYYPGINSSDVVKSFSKLRLNNTYPLGIGSKLYKGRQILGKYFLE